MHCVSVAGVLFCPVAKIYQSNRSLMFMVVSFSLSYSTSVLLMRPENREVKTETRQCEVENDVEVKELL